MLYLFIIIAVLVVGIYIFIQNKSFGKLPSGERLERIKKSPNWKDDVYIWMGHSSYYMQAI